MTNTQRWPLHPAPRQFEILNAWLGTYSENSQYPRLQKL